MKLNRINLILFMAGILLVYFLFIYTSDPSSESAEISRKSLPKPEYSGTSSCRSCHEPFYKLWAGSRHGTALQPYTPEFARKYLRPQLNPIKAGEQGAEYLAQTGPDQGRVIETIQGENTVYPISQVMGGKNVYYFLTVLDRGRLQTLPVAFDVNNQQWFDFLTSGIKHFPEIPADTMIPWTDSRFTFNTACYHCHVSQLSTNYDLNTDTYKTSWLEPGINCETCHGPGREHVKVCQSAQEGGPLKDPRIISTKNFTPQQTNSLCNSCHAKLSPVSTSFTPGDGFYDHFDLVTLESPDFYPDGRDRGENYTMSLWQMSPCVKNSDLDCLHCHTSSGRYRFREPGKAGQACLPCHRAQVESITRHSRHRQVEKSPSCISCHMPMTRFARMNRTDHSMRPPVPAATVRYQSPNACNLCHTSRNATWAQRKLVLWGKNTRQKNYLNLAELVDQSRRKNWKNLDQILAYIVKKDRDEVFGCSFIRSLRNCASSEKWPVLLQVLQTDPSPLLRAAAAESLEGYINNESLLALIKATRDRYRLVRVRAAASLAAVSPAQLQVKVRNTVLINDLQKSLQQAMGELISATTAQPDHYLSHYNLGNIYLKQGKIDRALAAYQNAARLKPEFIPLLVNIAFAYHAGGEYEKAEQSFRKALKQEPENSLILTNLALFLNEMGRLPEADAVFRRVLTLDPKSAIAAFNLAVILWKQNPSESLNFAGQAFRLKPADPRYAYTYAYFLHKTGKTPKAIAILKGVIARQTTHEGAYLLLGQIFEQKGKIQAAIGIYLKAAANPALSGAQRYHFSTRAKRLR